MAKAERLTARPVKHIQVEGGEGWLYLWNNGDTQMVWTKKPKPPHQHAGSVPSPRRSTS